MLNDSRPRIKSFVNNLEIVNFAPRIAMRKMLHNSFLFCNFNTCRRIIASRTNANNRTRFKTINARK
jgi:hypothetical protein